MRRQRFVVGVTALLIAAGAVAWGRARPHIDTSPANLARLKYGMTRAEVKAVLGGPPGDYRAGADPDAVKFYKISWCVPGVAYGLPECWDTDAGCVIAAFREGYGAYHLRWTETSPGFISTGTGLPIERTAGRD